MTPPALDDYITLEQWAHRLGISKRRAYELVQKGRVPGAIKAGTLIPRDAEDPRLNPGRPKKVSA